MLEYVPYTQRHALTTPFAPSEAEQTLYEHISAYLQRAGKAPAPGQPYPGAVHHPLGNSLTCRNYSISATQNTAMSLPAT